MNRLQHVRVSFRKQGFMRLLHARISRLEKGLVEISASNRRELSQQDGFVHAGVMATLADNAAGYSTLSLLPPGSRVLAVEFKLSFIRPAVGQAIRARGKVRKLGKTIALCEIEVETSRLRKWVSCAWGSETVYCDIAKSQNQQGPSSHESSSVRDARVVNNLPHGTLG